MWIARYWQLSKTPIMASAIAGREVTSGDEADAIGVALAGWKKIQERLMEDSNDTT